MNYLHSNNGLLFWDGVSSIMIRIQELCDRLPEGDLCYY